MVTHVHSKTVTINVGPSPDFREASRMSGGKQRSPREARRRGRRYDIRFECQETPHPAIHTYTPFAEGSVAVGLRELEYR
ncbi:hypothetical protein D623_10024096 [Myotis brandtii]|uniref:Uncharacterized protein n=1 Tax=Myotis brandtii TaxID=109478 RepID=S7N6F7_MYOBR|nr:hypothetical protein D623_10024096 [Myotis brandtii]